jgi:hypothetical protein
MAELSTVEVAECMPCSITKRPNLELKILPKQPLVYLLLNIAFSEFSFSQTEFVKKYQKGCRKFISQTLATFHIFGPGILSVLSINNRSGTYY